MAVVKPEVSHFIWNKLLVVFCALYSPICVLQFFLFVSSMCMFKWPLSLDELFQSARVKWGFWGREVYGRVIL